MVCLPLPLEGAMFCTAWPGCVILAQTLQVFSKGSAEGITLSSEATQLCACVQAPFCSVSTQSDSSPWLQTPCVDKPLMSHSTVWASCYLIRVGR